MLADQLGGLLLVAVAMVFVGLSLSLGVRYRWLGVGFLSAFVLLALSVIAVFVVGDLYADSVDGEDDDNSSAPSVVVDLIHSWH